MVMPAWSPNSVNTGRSISDPAPLGPIVGASLTTSGPQTVGNNAGTSASMYGGSGVPSAGLGANGDFYFRVDTPGTANQRIYIKSGGSWVGIV